ncbi:MAG TPA: hypothetical protein VH374_21635 [Polyangia bacterium]|jgi:hypothetical protein|nr:hypothetical protein [Polyangia bacterium]
MLVFFAALLVVTMAAPPLPITSTVSCPDTATVSSDLLRLAPGGFPPGYALRLLPDDPGQGSLRMELLDQAGQIVSKRQLSTGPSCAAVSEELAVVAATWLGDLPPPASLTMPTPPTLVVSSGPPRAIDAFAAAVAAGRWSVGLGTGVASPGEIWVTQAFALQTRLFFRQPSGFYLGAGAFGTWPRAHFQASWYRVRFLAEAGGHWERGPWGATVGAGAGGGWMVERDSLVGSDYLRGDGVVMAEGRVSYALEFLSAIRLWLGARSSLALNYNPAWNTGTGASPNSRYEGAVLAGCDFFVVR